VSDADRASRSRDVFPTFRVERVRRVELVHGAETLILDAKPGGGDVWEIEAPRREAADIAAVDALLRELEMATRVRDVQDGDAAGLDAPRVRGSVKVGPLDYRFVLGADAVTPEGAAYMHVDGEGTFVIGRSLKVQLLRGADAYRDRVFVPYGATEVARVEVHDGSGAGFVLERRGTSFRVGGPNGLRASSAAVERLFGAFADARAEDFLDDAAADRALSEKATAIVLTPRDSTVPRVRLLVGGSCRDEGVVAVRTEPARMSACVAKSLMEALGTTPDKLVDESPFVAHADEIEELRIERIPKLTVPGSRVDLARRGTGWHERAPYDRDLDPEQADSANALVAALAGAQAVSARPAESGERISPRSRATIVRTGTSASEVVEVAAPDAEGVFLAKRLEDGAVLRLSRAVGRRFEPHPIAIEGGAVWKAPVDPGAVVAIDDSCGPGAQRLELRDGLWKTRGFEVDARIAADLARSFARAKADAWVAEDDDGGFGFGGEGSCDVTLTLASDAEGGAPLRVGVAFGEPGEGGVYARTFDTTGVFIAPAAMRDLASHPAVDRRRFRIDPASLTRVVLLRSSAKLVLARARAGEPLARADGSAPDEKLEGALAALTADLAVHTGPPAREEGVGRPTLEIDATQGSTGGAVVETRIAIGAPTRDASSEGYFARVAGVDATFVVRKDAVNAILDAW
jgi:hypothetical protein